MITFVKNNVTMNEFDVIVPVPLHNTKKRERGFNQAHLLAQPLASEFGIPLSSRLERVRPGVSQTTLSRRERLDNVHGTFVLSRPLEFKDKNVLLVDDVFTTGATLSECSKVLRDHGARSACALTLARGDGR